MTTKNHRTLGMIAEEINAAHSLEHYHRKMAKQAGATYCRLLEEFDAAKKALETGTTPVAVLSIHEPSEG